MLFRSEARTQVEFSRLKGSLPVRTDADVARLDECARKGAALLADSSRVAGNGEMYMTPDQNGAMSDVITRLFHGDLTVREAQQAFAAVFGP